MPPGGRYEPPSCRIPPPTTALAATCNGVCIAARAKTRPDTTTVTLTHVGATADPCRRPRRDTRVADSRAQQGGRTAGRSRCRARGGAHRNGIRVTGVVVRVFLRYERPTRGAPRSMVAKLPMAETAQMSGYRAVQERDPERVQRYYERAAREVRFYRDVGAAFAPRMNYADSDDANRRVVLLLEDVSGGRQR